MLNHYDNKIPEAIADLNEDLEILLYAAKDALQKTETCTRMISKKSKSIPHTSRLIAMEYATNLRTAFESTIDEIHSTVAGSSSVVTMPDLDTFTEKKDALFHTVRSLLGILGGVLTSTDWQSPSFLYSLYPQAGRQTGEIYGTINDYKRDVHNDEKQYELEFIRQYIDARNPFRYRAYMTSNGMSAFMTLVQYLHSTTALSGPVIIGQYNYFECKEILIKLLGNKVIEVDELDTNSVISSLDTFKPSVVFFDSLCNATPTGIPNLPAILTHLGKTTTTKTFAVIDNTCLSATFRPLQFQTKNLTVLAFESLNKYHQLGFDRVTGGIIYTSDKRTDQLFFTREHIGSNISDVTSLAIPTPNKQIFMKRIKRFERNTHEVSVFLNDFILNHPKSILEGISYPRSTNTDSFPSSGTPFYGSFITLIFKPQYQSVTYYKNFINKIIRVAKKSNVQLVSGTSFGFPTSRIYLTALRTDYGTPFIRLSIGTEHRIQLEQLKILLSKSLQK